MRDKVTVYFWIEPTAKSCWAYKHVIPVSGESRTIRKILRFKRSDNKHYARQQIELWKKTFLHHAEEVGGKYEFIEGKPQCLKNTN